MSGGAVSCINIILRFLLTASALVAVMATTPFHRMVNGLRRMHFPAMLLMVLSFLHRYLFVLVDVARRMRRARDSRAVGGSAGGGGLTLGLRFRASAGVLGVLFLRSLDQSERVYAAMCSRGFSGELPALEDLRMRSGDWVFLGVFSVYAALLFLNGHPLAFR
jgi:cobalt/nickel transport system permease protein